MKKGLLLLIFGMMIMPLANAQKTAESESDTLPPMEMQQQMFIYSLSKKYNDPLMQRVALYNMLSWNPTNTAVLDSIALMYLDLQQYASAALISQDILKINPNDILALEIAAVSFETLGVKERAVPHYEKLYLLNQDLGILYQIAFMQLELNRYNEAINNADIIIADAKSETRKLLFPTEENGKTQEINLKASTYRLKAMIEEDRGNTDVAKEYYTKALEIAPEFYLAGVQLENLK